MSIPWNSMEYSVDLHGTFHGGPWRSMHGGPWNISFMEIRGVPLTSMELHGVRRSAKGFHGAMETLGTPWNSVAFHGTPWNSMEVGSTESSVEFATQIAVEFAVEFSIVHHGSLWKFPRFPRAKISKSVLNPWVTKKNTPLQEKKRGSNRGSNPCPTHSSCPRQKKKHPLQKTK